MAARGEISKQTFGRFEQLLHRFERFTRAAGATQLHEVDPNLVSAFVHARGRSRHGHVAQAALATSHLRRSVLRLFFRTAREIGLAEVDPTRDLELPSRTRGRSRPLSEDEAVAVRQAAEFVERPTRHAAAAALALIGAATGEIGHISTGDLDPTGRQVWVHGSSKTTPRWCPLDPWAARVLITRKAALVDVAPADADPGSLRLALSSRPGTDEQLQARSCVALKDLIKSIGLGADPTVRPASFAAYAGAQEHARTGRIEDAALRMGLRSLDATALAIGHRWLLTPER